MTVSLGQGGEGLGTVWGVQTAERMLREAGFTSVVRHEFPSRTRSTPTSWPPDGRHWVRSRVGLRSKNPNGLIQNEMVSAGIYRPVLGPGYVVDADRVARSQTSHSRGGGRASARASPRRRRSRRRTAPGSDRECPGGPPPRAPPDARAAPRRSHETRRWSHSGSLRAPASTTPPGRRSGPRPPRTARSCWCPRGRRTPGGTSGPRAAGPASGPWPARRGRGRRTATSPWRPGSGG